MKAFEKLLTNRAAVLSLGFLLVWVVLALAAPLLPLEPPDKVFDGAQMIPPILAEKGVAAHPLGTDDLGRDTMSRLIFGSRISLGFGFLCVVASVLIGGLLGVTAGFFGGWWDRFVLRLVDVLMALPSLLLAIVVVAVLGPSLWNALWAVTVVALPGFIRITRASVLAEREKEYVQASRAFGAGSMRQMFVVILPNCMAPLIVQASLGFSDGMHFCFNVVTTAQDVPEAVLVRALDAPDANGPGKLCRALRLNRAHNSLDLVKSEVLWIEDDGASRNVEIVEGPRVGIGDRHDAVHWPLRYGIKNHPALSKPKFSPYVE